MNCLSDIWLLFSVGGTAAFASHLFFSKPLFTDHPEDTYAMKTVVRGLELTKSPPGGSQVMHKQPSKKRA
jgi:hypothetical protein